MLHKTNNPMKKIALLLVLCLALSCQNKEEVDTIIFNAQVYTVNQDFAIAEAFAIKDGKFIDVGTTKKITNTYRSQNTIDLKGKPIFPGLIDAHCHFYGMGMNQQTVDLVGTRNFDDVMKRVLDFNNQTQPRQIEARGWDETDWEDKTLPTNMLLNRLFPDMPVILRRVDGHAAICNQAALDLGKITVNTKVDGGEIEVKDGKLTGILIDNAVDLVLDQWPQPTNKEISKGLLDAQAICSKFGLTTVDDAGLEPAIIDMIDQMQKEGSLKTRVYAMVSNSPKNLDLYLNKGIYKTDRLNVRSFKVYADGALGSRGALLKAPYQDKDNHFGLLLTPVSELTEIAGRIAKSDFQMNTHAIGDSANHLLLNTYEKALEGQNDRRWRMEHAQVIAPDDFSKFNNILPSVQPTHATSDMYWAEERLGEERIKGAYAYKQLLDAYGKIALGTDFPVEQVNPFLTFYAAVGRQDLKGFPEGGFQMENHLSREETLKGMTIWAAYSNFEENEKGSIEIGKLADFVILDQDLMTVEVAKIPQTKVLQTVIGGEVVYESESLAK